MKTSRSIKIVLATLAALAVVTVLYARTLRRPPAPADVVGAWHGYTAGFVEFLRLECDDDGTGYLSVSYLRDTPVRLYRIESWKLKGWTLEFVIHAVDAGAEPIWLRKARCTYNTVDFEFGGKGWERQVSLFNERKFATRASALRERIDSYRNDLR